MQDTRQLEIEVIVCPICETRDHEQTFLDEQLPTRFVRCRRCRSVYLNPRPASANRGTRAGDFVGRQLHIAESRRRAFTIISKHLHRYRQAGSCLDIGCNTGEFFDQFDPRAWRRYGIEPDADLAAYAAVTHGATVHPTLDNAKFYNGGFDVVTIIDTICLLPDPLTALKRIRQLLAPGGVLGLEFPGQAYMLGRSVGPINCLFDGRWSRLGTDGNHLHFFTSRGMSELLSIAGFRVLEWIPIPSPSQPGLRDLPIRMYYSVTRLIASRCHRVLGFCPKLLCIADRE